MAQVKIVTDSTCDLSVELARKYNISIVPCQVIFGTETYRDGIDITHEEFYRRLLTNKEFPKTSQPTPRDFINVYNECAKETNPIISIHVTGKLSGTYNTALQTANGVINGKKCRIDVIDSQTTTMALGFLVMTAGRLALEGIPIDDIITIVKETIPRTGVYAAIDNLDYLRRGGRISDAQRIFGSLLGIKPIITIRDGEAHTYRRVHTYKSAIDELYKIVEKYAPIDDLAVLYTTDKTIADEFVGRIKPYVMNDLYLTQVTPALGAHAGPGALGIAFLGKN